MATLQEQGVARGISAVRRKHTATGAAAGAVKTNATTDTAGMKCGVVVRAATTRGNDALVLIKPNA